jgi:DNA-binding CsgD family transcriptional regulator
LPAHDAPEEWLDCWGEIDGRARLVVTGERALLQADKRSRLELSSGTALRMHGPLIEPADPRELGAFETFLSVGEGSVNTLCLPRSQDGHLLMRAALLNKPSDMPIIGITFHCAGADFVPQWVDMGTIFGLTSTEQCVIKMMLNGVDSEDIASEQRISINSVRRHISRVYKKLAIASRNELLQALAGYRIN